MLQGRWVLESIAGRPVNADGALFFAIDGSSIQGFDGCNHFGGRLDEPEKMRTSQRGCDPNALRLPLQLPDPRRQLEAGTVEGDRLTLAMPGATGDAVFVKTPRE